MRVGATSAGSPAFVRGGTAMKDEIGAEGIKGAANRGLQRRATPARCLTPGRRKRFLDELAESCNVRRSAGEAGATQAAFYRLRQRDPEFAAAWEAALATGYARLEAELMAEALGEGGREDGRPPLDRDLAMSLLGRRDAAARAAGGPIHRRGARTRHIPMAEVEAALRRQLDLLARRLGERAGGGQGGECS